MIIKLYALALMATLCFLNSCAKDRPEQIEQSSQGKDLQTLSSYSNSHYQIDGEQVDLLTQSYSFRTGARKSALNLSSFSKVKASESVSGLNQLDLVDYDRNQVPLLGGAPFWGRENFAYEIRMVFRNGFLYLLKTGAKNNFPYQESSLGWVLPDGRIAIPLLRYKVKFYKVEKKKNENGEDTSTLIPVETNLEHATHFELDLTSREVLKAISKIDVYPASLFDGDWYYSETIVDASEEEREEIGNNFYSVDAEMKPATKVRFYKSEKKLKAVNINVDPKISASSQNQEINFTSVMEIPIDWVEYKVRDQGGSFEEEICLKSPCGQRPYIQIYFEDFVAFRPQGGKVFSRPRLVDLEIDTDYLSFTIQRDDQKTMTKYAFLRAGERDYVSRRSFEGDREKIGYLLTARPVVDNHELFTEEDYDKNTFINRLNPKKKEVVFHFAFGSPQKFRDLAKKAIQVWDEAFAKAGTPIHIRLDDTFDVALGDLRFNAINLIHSVSDSGLYGFGPSITDPSTGEIISVTTNVHLSSIRAALVNLLRKDLLRKTGLLKGSGRKQRNWILDRINRGECPQYSKYVGSLIADDGDPVRRVDVSFEDGKEILENCAEQLMGEQVLGTLVHELGHNFGLRHNFRGSTDSKNYYTQSEYGGWLQGVGEGVPTTSTVMDYFPLTEPPLLKPGKYDIAAIRFGYGNQVELDNGRILDLDPNYDMSENLKRGNAIMRPFAYCTDEDLHPKSRIDPLCLKNDVGSTPSEIVRYLTQDFYDQFYYDTYRFNRAPQRWGENREVLLAQNYVNRYFIPLRRFYDEWRFLLAKALGNENRYLESYGLTDEEIDGLFDQYFGESNVMAMREGMKEEHQTKIAFNERVDSLSGDPQFNEYRGISRAVFDFFKDLMRMNAQYCLLNDPAQKQGPIAVEFETVRRRVYQEENVVIRNCLDLENKVYFGQKYHLQFYKQIGHPLYHFRYSLDKKDLQRPIDILGSYSFRLNAAFYLTRRSEGSARSEDEHFFPNFLDEPQFRGEIMVLMLDRLLNGDFVEDSQQRLHIQKYTLESELLTQQMKLFLDGFGIPGKTTENLSRAWAFQSKSALRDDEVTKLIEKTQINDTYLGILNKKNYIAGELIRKRNDLIEQQKPAYLRTDFSEIFNWISQLPSQEVTKGGGPQLKLRNFIENYTQLKQLISAKPSRREFFKFYYFEKMNYLESRSKEAKMFLTLNSNAASQQALLDTAWEELERAGFKTNGSYPLYQELFNNFEENVGEFVTRSVVREKNYSDNRADFDAELNLITWLLQSRAMQ